MASPSGSSTQNQSGSGMSYFLGLVHAAKPLHSVMAITQVGFNPCPAFCVSSQNFSHVVPFSRGSPSGQPSLRRFSQAAGQFSVSFGSTAIGGGVTGPRQLAPSIIAARTTTASIFNSFMASPPKHQLVVYTEQADVCRLVRWIVGGLNASSGPRVIPSRDTLPSQVLV